jgi:hypothetical protein
MNRLVLAFLLTPLLAACSDSSSPTPPSSTPKTSAVSVTVSSPLRMGQTAQATGTETLSDGQSRAITSGWLSDALAVATVTNAGLVSGIANGRATIYVVTGGMQGQQVVRVVPDYQGRWSGRLLVTSCTETGIFADIDFCDDSAVGTEFGYSLDLSQSGTLMTALVDYGPPLVFPSVAAPIGEDGTSSFAPVLNVTESGFTLTLEAAFNINSTRVNQLTGTVNELWRLPNITGEARVAQNIVSTTRTGASAFSSTSEGTARRLRLFRRLAQAVR